MGSYNELISNRGAFADFLATYLQEKIVEDFEELGDGIFEVGEGIQESGKINRRLSEDGIFFFSKHKNMKKNKLNT